MTTPVAPTPVDPSTNPWNSMLSSDTQASNSIQATNAQTMGVMDSQIGAYGGTPSSTSTYPTMTNSYGLGTSSAPVVGSASNPSFNGQPITVDVPDTSSRGFNPWSLTGEANARGK